MREESWAPRFLKPLAGIIDRTMREESWVGRSFCIILAPFWGPFWLLLAPREGTGKQVFNKNVPPQAKAPKCLQNGSKMGPQNRKVGDIFGDIFQCFPVSFLGWILNGFLDGFWIDFGMNFVLYFDVFGYIFEAS